VASRQGAFRSLDEEVANANLPLTGDLPPWLGGTLVRVTPAKLEIGGHPTRHWFDGLAMLNAFTIGRAGVSYSNRFLHSHAYEEACRGRTGYVGIANDPCRSFFKRVTAIFEPTLNDNCNVNVARLGDRYLAMTEMPVPMEFDPETLAARGLVRWKDRLGGHFYSAHPHYDPKRREMLNYLGHVGPRSSYRIYGVAAGSERRRLIASLPTRKFAYIHSFGLTERHFVLAEFPLVLDPLKLLVGRDRPLADSLEWRPERPTRFFVVDRADGTLRTTVEAEGFFAFHHVNAFEDGDEIVVDLIVNEDGPSWIRTFEVENLRGDGGFADWQPRAQRFRLPLRGGTARGERLSDVRLDLPRVNYGRDNTRPYRHFYATSFAGADSDWLDQLAKVDVETGDVARWTDAGCYPGEPVFTPAPDAADADQGVVLSVVYDSGRDHSFLLVLDAQTFEEVARAEAPHHIPFGFHGAYFGENDDTGSRTR
jgi:carotenoid cleavage dioxygenase-like enzyme